MNLGFSGEVADFYSRYRRGYPPAAIQAVVDVFALTHHDVVVDLGCGTGQLTLPIASRVRATLGVDPEPDMLMHARRAADQQGAGNVGWMIGTDADMPAIGQLLGARSVGAVTVAQALHWMAPQTLFTTLASVIRPGGGVAVISNGAPLWLQETVWSHALRGCLERWWGHPIDGSRACGTDELSRQRYRDHLTDAGYEVTTTAVTYADELDLEQLLGGVYSALSIERLPPPDQRSQFEERIRQALHPQTRFTEQIDVVILTGRIT